MLKSVNTVGIENKK